MTTSGNNNPIMKKLCKYLILFYKEFISPIIPSHCKFTPSCSAYMADAIDEYGVIGGIARGTARLLRCNHFSKGGFDPVKINLKGKAKWIL